MEKTLINLFNKLNTKYGGINPEMLDTVLVPRYFEILELNKEVRKRGSAYTVTIKLRVDGDGEGVVRGQTGKILSKEFVESGDYWKELGKARIHRFDDNFAVAELFAKTGSKADLEHSLEIINVGDYMEIDNYGLSANLTSALSELAFSEIANSKGFMIKRMPEDIAKHLMDNDGYYNFDFLIEREGFSKKVEVKSLWGTNTDMARLIHSKTKDYATSSCKFETQDIFAVNLYLRTGKITDFAFAISEYERHHPNGLPCATKGKEKLTEYVHQNPVLNIGDGKWFEDLDDVWNIIISEKHLE